MKDNPYAPAPSHEDFDPEAFWKMVEEKAKTNPDMWVVREYLGSKWHGLSDVVEEAS